MTLLGRDRPPEEVRSTLRPALDRGERLRAWAQVSDPGLATPGYLVATDLGLWTVGGGERGRLRWEEIDKAVWAEGVLTVTETPQSGHARGPMHAFPLAEPGRLPEEVRSRVTASVAYTRYHRLTRAGGMRVVARRAPGTATLAWSVAYDPGVDLDDPLVREQAAQALAAAKELVGE